MKLKPWNQRTFNEAVKLIEDGEKRLAIVNATGTGKSTIIAELIRKYKVKTLLLAPSVSILNQFQEYNEFPKDDVTTITYAMLASMYKRGNLDQFKGKFNLIIADEMHRLGAPKWQNAFNFIIANNNGIVIGATATPKRTNQYDTDMVEELFDGNSVGNITLVDALREGILPIFDYNIGISSIYEAIASNVEKIKQNDHIQDEEKQRILSKIEGKVIDWEKSYGLKNTFKTTFKDSFNKLGSLKLIVFCESINEIQPAMDKVRNGFNNSFPNKRLFTYQYHTQIKSNEYDNFKGNNYDNSIQLLFVVNKLNEGVHIDGIDGAIMLRSTSSNIIYTQQIGRILSHTENKLSDKRPVLLDLTNNFLSVSEAAIIVRSINKNIVKTLKNDEVKDPKTRDRYVIHFNSFAMDAVKLMKQIESDVRALPGNKVYELNGVYYRLGEVYDMFPSVGSKGKIFRLLENGINMSELYILNEHANNIKHNVGKYGKLSTIEIVNQFKIPLKIVLSAIKTESNLEELVFSYE